MPGLGRASSGRAIAVAVGATLLSGGAIGVAFSPHRARTAQILAVLGVAFGLMAALTLLWLKRRGELRARMSPAYGDVTKGFLMALGLYVGAYLLHRLLTAHGSPRESWIVRAYLHIGDPFASGAWIVAIAVLVIAALEEMVWRGGVLALLLEAVGWRKALLLTTLLYGLSYAPTVLLLADPLAGPNPVLLVAALVGGALWGALVVLFRRATPVVIGHGLLVWALVAFPLWRP